MGTQALKSHVNGKKHKKLAQPLAFFFKPPTKKKKITPNSSNMVSPSQVPASSTLVQSIASPDKVKAEIRLAVKSVMSNFSNSSFNDISTLFKTMFPGSSIASNFAISEDKIRYMVNYGIAPILQRLTH